MNVEIQVALNFLISFLYNKLPRRRVNNFGEELESALRVKFEGHWYPEKPFKGSAFRCLKTTPPLDPVFGIAARESGMDLSDIQENLPSELSIWVDPGEVSYRMSEKGPVKILYSDSDRISDQENSEREVIRTFNPEAQCFKPEAFKPLDLMASHFNSMSIAPGAKSGHMAAVPAVPHMSYPVQPAPQFKAAATAGPSLAPYGPKQSNNVTLTAGMFAQTKFGSTKLKNSGKRSQRMSPTEFGNYIKQKALMQQQAAVASQQYPITGSPHNSRSISPESPGLPDSFMFMSGLPSNSPSPPNGSNSLLGGYDSFLSRKSLTCNSFFDTGNMDDLFSPLEPETGSCLSRYTSTVTDKPFPSSSASSVLGSSPESVSESQMNGAIGSQTSLGSSSSTSSSRTFDNAPYQNQYQHLLVAN